MTSKKMMTLSTMMMLTAFSIGTAHADTLYWDSNGTTTGFGHDVSGGWGGNVWSTSSSGTATPGAYVDGSDVVFKNDAAISLGLGNSTRTVNSITLDATAGGNTSFNTGTINLTTGIVNINSFYMTFSTNLVIAGNSGLTLNGTGSLSITNGTAANTFTGDITDNAGRLTIDRDNALGNAANDIYLMSSTSQLFVQGASAVEIGSGHDIYIGASGAGIAAQLNQATILGAIKDVLGGSGTLTKSGNSILVFAQNNSYTGQTVVGGGILRITTSGGLGAGDNTDATGTAINGGYTLQLDGTNGDLHITGEKIFSGGGVGLAGQSGALVNVAGNNIWDGNMVFNNAVTIGSDAGKLTLTGSLTTQSTGRAMTLNGAGDGEISGNISNVAAVIKNGTGTWILSGANTFGSGSVDNAVNTGTLLIDGATSVASNFTVAAAGTLGGSGSITLPTAKTVTVSGKLTPGSATDIGALTITGGNLALAGSATFQIDLASGLFDAINVGNLLTYGGVLNIDILTGGPGGTFDLMNWGSVTGAFSTVNITFDSAAPANGQSASFDPASGIVTIAIPEPASVAFLLLASGGLLATRRRNSVMC